MQSTGLNGRNMTAVRWLSVLILVGLLGSPWPEATQAAEKEDPTQVFFARHCQACHAGTKPKGKFKLDSLTSDFGDKANRARWLGVLEQVKGGSMPPAEKPRP
jgi:mono/diheme cytochrome c family protein